MLWSNPMHSLKSNNICNHRHYKTFVHFFERNLFRFFFFFLQFLKVNSLFSLLLVCVILWNNSNNTVVNAALFDVVTTQEWEGKGRISCVGGGGIPFCRCNVSLNSRRFPISGGVIWTSSFPYNSVRSQCESTARGNMATSQHEGHANQLDLLIRAGNVHFCTQSLDPGAKVNARLVFLTSTTAPQYAE